MALPLFCKLMDLCARARSEDDRQSKHGLLVRKPTYGMKRW
ncbi:hypothetical protein ACTJK5_03865 [Agrobacterium sp. 22094]|nr:hypothetical protein [Agrobacterium cavarae]